MTKEPVKRNREKGLGYESVLEDIADVIKAARRSAVRTVNATMTGAYWLIGPRSAEFGQRKKRK